MNAKSFFKIGTVLCSALLGYTTYGQPSVSVGVSVPVPSIEVSLPSVEIRAESDFYEPLTPHGEWVVVGSHGRCFRPARIEAGWRPYCNGNWQRTDAGWYWVSDEPWAWATYHYGRWDFTDEYGWYWVPQTQWAPAWVSWHSGGGYVGWAPLLPSVRISASGFVGFDVAIISPRAFVFVEQRGFLNPIRPSTVVVNNTTIIKQTVNITNTKIVNNTVINEGPEIAAIEKASGRKVQAVAVRELRQKQEAGVVSKQRNLAKEKKADKPASAEVEPRGKKSTASQPSAPDRESTPPKNREVSEKQKSAPAAPEFKSEARPSSKEVQRPAKEKPATKGKNKSEATPDKEHEKKPKN